MSKRSSNLGRRVWRVGKLTFLVALVAGAVYWVKFSPIAVTEYQIARGPIVSEVMGTGTLEARIAVMISPKISGRIKGVRVDQGDRVKAGDLLVQLEDDEYQQQVAIAVANHEAARSATARLAADTARAHAVADQAKRLNGTKLALRAQNAATQDEVDTAAEALAVAQAGLSSALAATAEGRSALLAAGKTLDYHRARLTDTQIVAPFAGLIVRRHREAGDIVVPGNAILTLISTDELWISAWVDETEMEKLKVDQTARVVFRSDSERSYPGTVARLGKEADRETREFIVDVRVLDLPGNWAVGQRAEVFIHAAQKQSALLMPTGYVQWQDRRSGAWVSSGGQAQWRDLTIGLRSLEMVEIVEGLENGDTVVLPINPRVTLRPGRRISGR